VSEDGDPPDEVAAMRARKHPVLEDDLPGVPGKFVLRLPGCKPNYVSSFREDMRRADAFVESFMRDFKKPPRDRA
jgi:hypothetical protein